MKTVAHQFILGYLPILGYAFPGVVAGAFRRTVPHSDITAIKPTRNPLSSPADKSGFLIALEEAAQAHE